jgi:hypothetical protein
MGVSRQVTPRAREKPIVIDRVSVVKSPRLSPRSRIFSKIRLFYRKAIDARTPIGIIRPTQTTTTNAKQRNDKMDKLIEFARKQDTAMLITCVKAIGGATPEHRMSRAAMIEVIIERNGEEFGDKLMDDLGL